jgi:hypothetical protein
MKKIKYKGLFRFVAGQNKSEAVYCCLKSSAMAYKYRSSAGLYIKMTPEDLSANPALEFKESDNIKLIGTNTFIDGKKLRELFVAAIFAKYLDSLDRYEGFEIKGKHILLGYAEEDRGTDAVIFITNDMLGNDNNYFYRAIAGKSSLAFYLQVKEYYNFEDFRAKIVYPKDFNLAHLNINKLKSYNESILIYVRSFSRVSYSELKSELLNNGLGDKNIILIGMEAGPELPHDYFFWDFKKDSICTTPIPDCNLFTYV